MLINSTTHNSIIKPNILILDAMKIFLTFLSILSLALFASCGGGASEAEDSNASEAPATEAEAPAAE